MEITTMTKDEALKLALEALENSAIKHPQQIAPRDAAIAAIREALAQPAAQAEPASGFQCEPQFAVTDDGFCEWVCPKPSGYLMQCCDCNLIHEVDFRVAEYEPRPSEQFIVSNAPNLQVQLRMKRRDDLLPTAPQTTAQAEPNEADQLLTALRLDPDTYRTDGGWLNIPKIRAAIASPADYPYTKEQ